MTQSWAISIPSESRRWIGEPYTSPNYKDYVEALCPRIIDPTPRQIIDVDYLPDELHSNAKASHKDKDDWQYLNHPLQGRILIIENPTVDVGERLGIELDIDPLFFALHLHTTHRTGMRNLTLDEATLPSRLRLKDYINISYHRPVTCRDGDLSNGRFVRDIAIDRKLVFLHSTTIGLAQHRASAIKVQHPDSFWLAIMLVDLPLAGTYFFSGHKDRPAHQLQLDLQPFLGNYENFVELPKFSKNWSLLKK